MKLFIMHDDTGKIFGTFAAKQDNVAVEPMAGMQMHIIESGDTTIRDLGSHLRNLHTQYRLQSGSGGKSLVKISNCS